MKQSQKNPFSKNPIESLRESSSEALNTVNNELLRPMADEFVNQILGRKKKFSGELQPGDSVEMKNVVTGKQGESEKLRNQLIFERRLHQEEILLVEKRSSELRLEMEAIQVQVTKLAEATPTLVKELQIAAFQAPVNPGIYDLFFLKEIFRLIKTFTEDIQRASVWLHMANARAHKKNVWGERFKKHGAKYLLSGEHYSGRSAA